MCLLGFQSAAFSKCHVFTLLPFQGVDIIFLFHIPRVPLRLPWARRSIGLSARLGFRLPWARRSIGLSARLGFRLPWARRSIGLSARLGFRLPWVGLIAIYMRAKERIFEENSKRAGVLLRGFEADLYIFKQISQYLIKSVQLYLHPVCNIRDFSRGALQCGLNETNKYNIFTTVSHSII